MIAINTAIALKSLQLDSYVIQGFTGTATAPDAPMDVIPDMTYDLATKAGDRVIVSFEANLNLAVETTGAICLMATGSKISKFNQDVGQTGVQFINIRAIFSTNVDITFTIHALWYKDGASLTIPGNERMLLIQHIHY
jgi:hypothetical protein